MNEMRVDPKTVADQLGHTVDVNQNIYTLATIERRLLAVHALESAVNAVPKLLNGALMEPCKTSESQVVDFKRAGDGDRTRDVQLGKMTVYCLYRTYASMALNLVHRNTRIFEPSLQIEP